MGKSPVSRTLSRSCIRPSEKLVGLGIWSIVGGVSAIPKREREREVNRVHGNTHACACRLYHVHGYSTHIHPCTQIQIQRQQFPSIIKIPTGGSSKVGNKRLATRGDCKALQQRRRVPDNSIVTNCTIGFDMIIKRQQLQNTESPSCHTVRCGKTTILVVEMNHRLPSRYLKENNWNVRGCVLLSSALVLSANISSLLREAS